jgi:hypothetical protein
MLHTYEGFLDKGQFFPLKPMDDIKGRYRVIVTIVDELAEVSKETPQARALREFYEAIDASGEDNIETFERVNLARDTYL